MTTTTTVLLVGALLVGLIAVALLGGRWVRRRMLDPPGVRAAAQALRTAGLAAPPLRDGLTADSAAQALPYLLALLETPGVALCDPQGRSLGAQGAGGHHVDEVAETVRTALRADRRQLATLRAVRPARLRGDPGGGRSPDRVGSGPARWSCSPARPSAPI